MIQRSPSLFHIEEGEATTVPRPAASGQLAGLRLIIEPSPPRRQRGQPPLAVLRRSTLRVTATSKCQGDSDGRISFVGLEFLKSCLFCRKKIDGTMDIFMYKGDQAFCSAECRCRQMAEEKRREIEIAARKRRDAFHSLQRRRALDRTGCSKPLHNNVFCEISSFC